MKSLGVAVLATLLLGTAAHAVTYDFTTLPGNTAVTDQYAGVTFSLLGGNDPFGPPTTSTLGDSINGGITNTHFGGSYPTSEFLIASFSSPASGVSFSFNNEGFNGANSYSLYDSSHSLITSGLLNGAGSASYNLSAYAGVASIAWDNGLPASNGGNWWQSLQSLTFTAGSPVPEPGCASLWKCL